VRVRLFAFDPDLGEPITTHRSDARVVRKHKPADAVVRRHVRRPACQCDLDGRGAPWYKICKLAFSDAEKRLVHLYIGLKKNVNMICGIDFLRLGQYGNCAYVGGIHVSLDNVEDRDVARRLARHRGNHPIFRL
jgi:hypothetical protein